MDIPFKYAELPEEIREWIYQGKMRWAKAEANYIWYITKDYRVFKMNIHDEWYEQTNTL